MVFFNKEISEIFHELNSSPKGISNSSVEQRKQTYGENKLDSQKKSGFFKKLLHEFSNIMIIILIISAIISLSTAIINHDSENLFEGILIFVIVIVNAIVGVAQEQKAENALDALKQSTQPFVNVIRNGNALKVKNSDIVVGDIVILKTGNFIPADIRLIECNNLKCNESSLTGESHSVGKTDTSIKAKNLPLSKMSNMCFSGTSVTSGSGKGIVVSVGKNTEIGKIAKVLNTQIKQITPLEKNIDKIGKFITFFVLAITIIVFVIQIIVSKQVKTLDALLMAIALAVAAIPESLPTVITIIMALGVQKLSKQNAIIKKLSAVETLGCCNIICTDKTGTLTENNMTVKQIYYGGKTFDAETVKTSEITSLIKTAALCNNAIINKDGKISADATETAISKFLISKNIDIASEKNKNPRLKESEFNSTKKHMSVTCMSGGKPMLFVKGALDYIINSCFYFIFNDSTIPLTEKYKHKILNENEKLCENGERVIAFAYGESMENLTFVGLVGIIDPPRKEAKKSINLCKQAGLKVVMITGDHPSTAFAIAKHLGITSTKKEILTGDKLDKTSAKELSKIISNYSVFARVTPEHKLTIVEALKLGGNIVAMTGDGVNDAPSIKAANIGVCMGITGTDVTKEVADIVISDDNFSSIVSSIKEGRTIYGNISKTITFLLSTNLVEVLGIFVTSLFLPNAVFLLPVQILFINLVTDSLPAFALGIELPEPTIMSKLPRNPNKSLLSGKTGLTILYQGLIQSAIVLFMFISCSYHFGSETASTMSFLTICLMQIIHAINCKSDDSIFKKNIFSNTFFNFSFIILLSLILCVYFIPALSSIFGLTYLSSLEWLIVASTSISIIPLVELGKIFIK